ncbi:Hypothetical protein ETEE_0458 [Edwardsiella anguillarum ET080813]|uniref:Uncharacterized protein n=1 Tax=Edwardsiella anguillarum ET080813 TaxID=667120 RepID=A0A076LFM0_9GAMM|nr:Hypothetical protein ETEE_0458 [Edwardsiella anguillarum ET080813]
MQKKPIHLSMANPRYSVISSVPYVSSAVCLLIDHRVIYKSRE